VMTCDPIAEAAGAVDQDGVTFDESGDHGEVGVDGGGDLGDGGRLDVGETGGNSHDLRGGHRDFVGVAAAVEQRAHLVAQ
jgi:hypothetical protein